jgi:nicotinate-nucleotide adenylyltransferase
MALPTQKIVVMGGSFDPIHNGHLGIISAIYDQISPDKLILIPATQNPHKPLPSASPQHRLEMIRLATVGQLRIVVDPIEIETPPPSYTYLTIAHLLKVYPNAELSLVIGDDNYATFHTWKHYTSILDAVSLIVINRPTHTKKTSQNEILAPYSHKIHWLPMPPIPTSSSEIKQKIASNRSIKSDVPSEVEAYISQHALYR